MLRISDFSLPDKSLPNIMLWPTQLCVFSYIGGLFMATQSQFIANNRLNAQKSTSTRFLQMSLVNPADCFMQNKPNLLDAQMNVTKVLTRDYDNSPPLRFPKNKPNSKPIKPNLSRRLVPSKLQRRRKPLAKPDLVRHSLGDGGFKRGHLYRSAV